MTHRTAGILGALAAWAIILLIAAILLWLFTPANAQTITTQCNTMGCGVEPWPEQLLPTYCMKDGIPIPACSMTFESHVTTPRCPEGYTLMRYVDNLSLVCARQIAPVIWDDKHD